MHKNLYQILFVVMLTVASSAHAAMPAMPEIPATLPDEVRQRLIDKRKPLAEKKLALIDEADNNKKKCTDIVAGSKQHRTCLEMQKDFNARVEILRTEFEQLSDEIDAAVDKHIIKNTDPMVVDARNVPSGLPKSVEAEIPDTPAGNRVRKGFQAIMDHDWNVARAWFQDALNHEPDNAGIKRLIDFAEYMVQNGKQPRPPASTRTPNADDKAQIEATMATLERIEGEKMDEDLARALDDFYLNYLPKHPELLEKEKPSIPAKKTDAADKGNDRYFPAPAEQKANWKAFFDYLFTRPPRNRRPTTGVPRG